MNVRMMPPPVVVNQTVTVNGRTYSGAPGVTLDVPDFDAGPLAANGWIRVGPSGTTAQRPGTSQANGTAGTAAKGTSYFDISLAVIDAAVATNAATTTSSPTLGFAAVPSTVLPGMAAFDATNGNALGTVLSTTATTVTLTANAAHAVTSGDVVTFSLGGKLIFFDGQTFRDPATGAAV
jgi:hypothetical protein